MKKKNTRPRLHLGKKTIYNLSPGDLSLVLGGYIGGAEEMEDVLKSKKPSCKTNAPNSSPCKPQTCMGPTCLFLDGC